MQPSSPLLTDMHGLTESEVLARRRRGLDNAVQIRTTRTYFQILRHNAFTFINLILFSISIVLILMDKFGDALVTAGLVLLNVVVGVYQEGRAKRMLERIALLTRPRATVIRDGQAKSIDPAAVVHGDLLRVEPGDQIVVDGEVVGEGRMEIDESLLSGESEPIHKHGGDPVLSGSYCVAGSAHYVAQKVGADSYVNQLTAQAQAYREVKTPLQRDIDLIIRVLVLVTTQVGILLGISVMLSSIPPVEIVRMAAVLVALVPQGLFFMTTVAYAMGAVRVAGQGALIQRSNAVESTSYVNLLCLDKTGTLTTNRISFNELRPLSDRSLADEASLVRLLGDFAACNPGGNRTIEAIRQAFPGTRLAVRADVPFASERMWSALTFDDASRPGTYVLGAPEVLQIHLKPGLELPPFEEWTSQGLRVLLFAHHPGDLLPKQARDDPELPDGLVPLALISLRDELRPQASETIRHFSSLGIGLKIISGDNPQTVAALARQAGVQGELLTVSGPDLETMDEAKFHSAMDEATIFGRITPQQKERLVDGFAQQGYYVAMIGDGVNDVLSLKQAALGVAMQSGSAATRGVADVVLLGDSFASLPVAFREGQRIVKGMEDVVRLLLTRTLYVLLLIVTARLVGAPFPVTPKHNSILALLTVGVPILAIAAWARPGQPLRIIRSTGHFVFPAAFTISIVTLAVYLAYLSATGDVELARTALTTASVFCGLLLIPFVEPPTAGWVGGDILSGDRRPTYLAIGMLVIFGVFMEIPITRRFFELSPLSVIDYGIIALAAAIWALLLRWIWRRDLLTRLLGLQLDVDTLP
jgi:cation-transporting ATPase E